MLVFGAAAAALLIVAMLPRVGRRKDVVVEDDRATTTGDGRFERDGARGRRAGRDHRAARLAPVGC